MTAEEFQDADVETQSAGQSAGGAPQWHVPSFAVLPSHVRALAVVVLAVVVWLAAELFWPGGEFKSEVLPSGGAVTAEFNTVEIVDVESAEFKRMVSSRKLFVPDVPVAARTESRVNIKEMLGRLKLRQVFEDGDELAAVVEVLPRVVTSRNDRGRRQTSSSSGARERVTVRKGDNLLDFTVVEVTKEGLKLKMEGFEEHETLSW